MNNPTNKKRKERNDDMEVKVPSTHCCQCHMSTIDKLTSSIHTEYKKTITSLEEMNHSLLKSLQEKRQTIDRLNEEIQTITTNLCRDLEHKHNKIVILQQIIRGIRSDVKRGKQLRDPTPIKTEVSLGFLIELKNGL